METTLVSEARKIGRKEANIALFVAFGIDVIIVLCNEPKSFVFSNDAFPAILVWMIAMIFVGRSLSQKSAVRIIVHNDGFAWAGIWCFLATMALSVFIGGVFVFISESIGRGSFATDITGYLVGGPLVIMIYSFIPISVHGIWFGYRIYNRGKLIQKTTHDTTAVQD